MPTQSPTTFHATMVERLDKLYASPQAIAQRTRLREILAVRSGEVGLDIGCGLGHLACELAREVAPSGRIIAIDSSSEMLDGSRLRVDELSLGDSVETRLCDAMLLNLPDDSVDFAVAAQVYCYVREVARAVAEAARVLRKGGRLVVSETDWDMCIYESGDRELTRRMLDGNWRFAHSHLPRSLHRLFRQSGLVLKQCVVFPIIETQYDPDSFGAGLVAIARDAAVRHGTAISVADAWATDICSRSSEGDYFFCTNRFIFVAEK